MGKVYLVFSVIVVSIFGGYVFGFEPYCPSSEEIFEGYEDVFQAKISNKTINLEENESTCIDDFIELDIEYVYQGSPSKKLFLNRCEKSNGFDSCNAIYEGRSYILYSNDSSWKCYDGCSPLSVSDADFSNYYELVYKKSKINFWTEIKRRRNKMLRAF